MAFTNLLPLDNKRSLQRNLSVHGFHKRRKRGITNNLDGSQDDLVYNSTEDTDGLDDSFIENLFASDSELDFEGFIV